MPFPSPAGLAAGAATLSGVQSSSRKRGLGVLAGNLGKLVDSVDSFLDIGCQKFHSGCVVADEASDVPVSSAVPSVEAFQGAAGLVHL